MKLHRYFFVLVAWLFLGWGHVFASAKISDGFHGGVVAPVRFDFQSVSVAQAVQLIYSEALKAPYVIGPDVLTDARVVSFRFSSDSGEVRPFFIGFLDSLGFTVDVRNGVDYVVRKVVLEHAQADSLPFVYRPRFRDVSYLARLLGPLFQGSFSVNRGVSSPLVGKDSGKSVKSVPDGSASALIDFSGVDSLVFSGSESEIKKLQLLLPQVDFASGEVMVRSVVYEVTTGDKEGSAFSLVGSVLGARLGVSVGAAQKTGDFFRIGTGSFEAVFSALSSDNRFRVVSSPSLRVKSGGHASFSVGQDVPVLGAVSYPSGSGQAVQSVEYRSSGVLFDVSPTLFDSSIDLSIDQQLSNFVGTTTGVNNSPTLTKRSIKTSVSLQDGDVIVLGGLTESKVSSASGGLPFLPRWARSSSGENSKTEVLLVLQVNRL